MGKFMSFTSYFILYTRLQHDVRRIYLLRLKSMPPSCIRWGKNLILSLVVHLINSCEDIFSRFFSIGFTIHLNFMA